MHSQCLSSPHNMHYCHIPIVSTSAWAMVAPHLCRAPVVAAETSPPWCPSNIQSHNIGSIWNQVATRTLSFPVHLCLNILPLAWFNDGQWIVPTSGNYVCATNCIHFICWDVIIMDRAIVERSAHSEVCDIFCGLIIHWLFVWCEVAQSPDDTALHESCPGHPTIAQNIPMVADIGFIVPQREVIIHRSGMRWDPTRQHRF